MADHLRDLAVEHQRRVHVDVAHDHAVVLEEPVVEHEPRHLDRVEGPFGGGDGSEQRLRAVAEVHGQHVEVALVDGHVGGFADDEAGVVGVLEGLVDLHQAFEVGHRAVAPAVVEVADEGHAVARGEHGVVPADGDRAFRVAGVLDELPWCAAGDDVLDEPRVEAHPLAVDVGAGLPEQVEGGVIAPDFDADLGEDPVGVLLDEVEAALCEQVVVGDLALELLDVPAGPVA